MDIISLGELCLAVLMSRLMFLHKLKLPDVPVEALEYGPKKVFLLASLVLEFDY